MAGATYYELISRATPCLNLYSSPLWGVGKNCALPPDRPYLCVYTFIRTYIAHVSFAQFATAICVQTLQGILQTVYIAALLLLLLRLAPLERLLAPQLLQGSGE